MAGLTDQLELLVTVIPKFTDQVRLDVEVFHDRVSDAVLLEVEVAPPLTDTVLLLANVVNQEFETEAQGKVLAPTSEVTFL
jgi:hypothetical protein